MANCESTPASVSSQPFDPAKEINVLLENPSAGIGFTAEEIDDSSEQIKDFYEEFLFSDVEPAKAHWRNAAAAMMVEHARDLVGTEAAIRMAIDENLVGITEYSPESIGVHNAWNILRRASRSSVKAMAAAFENAELGGHHA